MIVIPPPEQNGYVATHEVEMWCGLHPALAPGAPNYAAVSGPQEFIR
jgi:hypothetical protein